MSTTRSPSHAAPATERALVLISHGSPSDPDPQEAFIRSLADEVSRITGITVRGATLAAEGALGAAVSGLSAPVIFPHFMSDGWFVSVNLPKRLRAAGLVDWQMCAPLGLTRGLAEMAAEELRAKMAEHALPIGETTLVLAAHGSPSDPRPARATQSFADALASGGFFADVRVGYVDEAPALAEAATVKGPAIVLPFFAARAGHVLMDVPDALDEAGFEGPVLEPIGTWAGIPRLIAQSVLSIDRVDAA
ncbi:MAG: cobalamin biosynthesis protein CbiX [Alphaproteobacteria bacterium]|nr:cobalamin biosynthesis protein CbiX [Alphaproteobacteria bacterium]